MKLEDLDKQQQLVGLKIKIPKKLQLEHSIAKEMYICSGWNRGLWLKKKMSEERIYPLTFEKWEDIKGLEILKERKKDGRKRS